MEEYSRLYLRLILATEEAIEIFETAWRRSDELNFVLLSEQFRNGKNYSKLMFISQKDLSEFNRITRTVLGYKCPREKISSLMNFSEERAQQIFSSAQRNNVNFEVFAVEGHDSDYYKNYHIRLKSRKDLNEFYKILRAFVQ